MSQTKAQLLDNIKDNVQLDARNSLRFADTDSSHYVAFKAPATVSSNVTWTLPAADGSANYVLATDGSGNLSWIADPAGQWVTSGSNIYFTGGNVGIGDTSPSNPLSVTGASAFNGDVTFTGASYNVTWDKSADDLIFNDNAKAAFGTSSDLSIYHDGSDSYIKDAGTGILVLQTNYLRVNNAAGNETIINAIENGAVELYYDNSKTFETVSGGALVTGNLIVTAEVGLFNGATNASRYIDAGLGDGNTLFLRGCSGGDANHETLAQFTRNGAVTLFYDASPLFATTDYGTYSSGTGAHRIPNGTSAQRPTGANGMIRYNSTSGQIEGYRGGAWSLLTESPIAATGGTTSESGGYKYHTFTSSGTFQVTSGAGDVDALIIAGGGGGGGGQNYYHGGGGGAGGMIELTAQTVSAQSYTITIGGGGSVRSNGSNSSALGSTAVGGGAGGSEHSDARDGHDGGSGGGASYTGSGGSATSGQGNDGGTGASNGNWATGGGGGKGATGGTAANNSNAGSGGNGKQWLNGTTYAGGGGGCTSGGGTPGSGGSGGGGNGALNATNHGSANTGGGGGGSDRTANGGNGGSGIVIIRYAV